MDCRQLARLTTIFDSTSEMIGLGRNDELFCTLYILRASSDASWLSQTKEESLPTNRIRA
eukprot:scaffold27452_cov78-Skeletonema_dohrnii-CCMP3373.AAC.1